LSFSGFFVVMCVMDLELFYAVQVCWSGQFGLWWLLFEAVIWDACKRWIQQSLKQYKLSAQSSCTTKELHCGLGLHSTSSSYSRREAALGMYLLPSWRLDVLLLVLWSQNWPCWHVCVSAWWVLQFSCLWQCCYPGLKIWSKCVTLAECPKS
jgi:hypothetical protein